MIENPLSDRPTVAVTAVGRAEGSRGAAAALACADADLDRATLLVDVGDRPPRPTLLASAAAQRLEERLAAHLPDRRVAARGQLCQLAVPSGREGFEVAASAVSVARGALAVLHLPPDQLQSLLAAEHGPRLSGVLLRADLATDRPMVALLARDLLARGFALHVLKHRLNWIAERRALFGALSADSPGGLSSQILGSLLSHQCYIASDGPRDHPAGAAQPERGDYARARSR